MEGAPVLLDVGDELVLEMRQCRPQSHRRAVAKRAEGVAENALAECVELFDVAWRTLARLDPAQDLDDPIEALAAGRALAAGFMVEELDDARRDLHHAGRIVDDDHAGRTEHRARGRKRIEVHADVEPALGDERRTRRRPG